MEVKHQDIKEVSASGYRREITFKIKYMGVSSKFKTHKTNNNNYDT